MYSNRSLQNPQNPPFPQFAYSEPMSMPMPVHKAQSSWTSCLIAMVVIGLLLMVGGAICVLIGNVEGIGVIATSTSSKDYQCSGTYSCSNQKMQTSKILTGIGSSVSLIGFILFIAAIVKKRKRDKQHIRGRSPMTGEIRKI